METLHAAGVVRERPVALGVRADREQDAAVLELLAPVGVEYHQIGHALERGARRGRVAERGQQVRATEDEGLDRAGGRRGEQCLDGTVERDPLESEAKGLGGLIRI